MQRTATLAAAAGLALVASACDRNGSKADIDIPTAQTRAALSLSAFECSHLASARGDGSRLFNLGLQAGRDFLDFAGKNATGYRSIAPQVDPVWVQVESRPTTDFKLGELYAVTQARADDWRRGLGERAWESRREMLYREKNCQFLALPADKR